MEDLAIADFEKKETIRVNHQVRSPKVRVVLEDGEQLGVMSSFEALKEAERRGFDLVEISPKAQPPVCKIMDYGKFKYELKKKSQGTKKSAAASIVKEITLSPSTDQHDLDFKTRNGCRFLGDGHRVKVSIRFRGREMAHPEIGHRQMQKVVEMLKDFGVVEQNAKMEGRMLSAVFAPTPQAAAKAKLLKASAGEAIETKAPESATSAKSSKKA